MNGKKYKQLTRNGTCNLSKVTEYRKYLEPSKYGKKMLYCVVTRKEINNIPSHIENHVTGRKFQRDLKIYLKNHGDPETGSVKMESSAPECKGNVDDDYEMDEEKEVEGNLAENEVEGFVGGIWYPNGIDFDSKTMEGIDINMDAENADKDENETGAVRIKKNTQKRKMKDNKKSKLTLAASKKKSR